VARLGLRVCLSSRGWGWTPRWIAPEQGTGKAPLRATAAGEAKGSLWIECQATEPLAGVGWYSACIRLVRFFTALLFYGAVMDLARTP